MIRQTIGFNWGAGGVSTNVWKGVPLHDLLLAAGISDRDMAGKHVEFIGHEDLPNKVGPGPFKDEPWGKLVKYGTSTPLARAMNPAYDILIAYEANGERRQPDHGFPVCHGPWKEREAGQCLSFVACCRHQENRHKHEKYESQLQAASSCEE